MRPLHLVLMALVLVSASPAEARDGEREPLTRVHAVGGGYHFHWLTTDLTGGMRFHGPAVGYSYDVGRTVRFMIHGKFFFPVVGRMDNDNGSYSGAIRSDYGTAWGVDGTMAVGRQFTSDRLVLIFGGGLHMMGVRINSEELLPIETITMGAGGLVRLRRSIGKGDTVQIGVDGQIGADFLSLLRQVNPINLLVTGSVLGTLGFKF
jgi:hypothetical protein